MKKKKNYIKIPTKSLFLYYVLNRRNRDIKNKKKYIYFFLNYFSLFKVFFLKIFKNTQYNKLIIKYNYATEDNIIITKNIFLINFYIFVLKIYNLYLLLVILNKNNLLLVKKKPSNNGSRWVKLYINFFKKNKKNNIIFLKNKSGRNISGKITTRHRKSINSFYLKTTTIFYSKILLVSSTFNLKRGFYPIMELMDFNKNFYYTPRIAGLGVGNFIKNFPLFLNDDITKFLGSNTTLNKLYLGFIFCNLKLLNNSKISTSSGSYCVLVLNDLNSSLVKIILPSGKTKILNGCNVCTIGRISNENKKNLNFGKAGFLNKLGIRPTVRGVAMNPVDHPHGGRTKTNSPEKSPWGWVTKYNK